MRKISLALIVLSMAFGSVLAQDRASIENGFQNWLTDVVKPKALSQGVSNSTFDAAFDGVKLNWDLSGLVFPGMEPRIPDQQSQPEFRSPADYFQKGGIEGTAAIGRRVAERYAETLAEIEAKSGVPGRIILAIWARESGFGNAPITYNAFQVLGSRAYASDGEYLTNELIAALKIAEAGHVPQNEIKSSWAGALGQPQFMPASFLAYAADGDGDGRKDIWRSDADTMASIANFLEVHGWDPARDWGFEVSVPKSASCALEGPDQGRRIAEWENMGIARVSGRSFPEIERNGKGFLLMPAGRLGPAFIVTPNFYVLKRYNRSDLYALYVGNLGDRIQFSVGDFVKPWDQIDDLFRSDISGIQSALDALGHDVGGVDGLPGYKTRRSIGRWQQAMKLTSTCFPETSVKDALRE